MVRRIDHRIKESRIRFDRKAHDGVDADPSPFLLGYVRGVSGRVPFRQGDFPPVRNRQDDKKGLRRLHETGVPQSRRRVSKGAPAERGHYPGTGHWSETGKDDGEGYTVNIPLGPGKTDQDYIYIFEQILSPISGAFKPEFILVSAGFDIYEDDPLGGMLISDQGFGAMTYSLLKMAKNECQDRILFALEGGYNPGGLRSGCKQVLLQLSGQAPKPGIEAAASAHTQRELVPVMETHRKHWPL